MVVSLVPEEAILLWTRELKKKRNFFYHFKFCQHFPKPLGNKTHSPSFRECDQILDVSNTRY